MHISRKIWTYKTPENIQSWVAKLQENKIKNSINGTCCFWCFSVFLLARSLLNEKCFLIEELLAATFFENFSLRFPKIFDLRALFICNL